MKTETLESLARREALAPERALAVGAWIAKLHEKAKRRPEGADYRALVDRNFESMMPLIESLTPARDRLAMQRFAAAFLIGWAAVLEARAKSGNVVDGNGDLRPENFLFDGEDMSIVEGPRAGATCAVDVADELGSLVTELAEITGNRDAGDAVVAGYRDAGGAAQPETLMAFFGAYRAQVRATAAIRASEVAADPRHERELARRLLDRSRRLAWQARGHLSLRVTGSSVSRKSLLAAALGRSSGLPVLSLDATTGSEVSVVAMWGEYRDAHLAIDIRTAVSMQVDAVASWLDSLMAAGGDA